MGFGSVGSMDEGFGVAVEALGESGACFYKRVGGAFCRGAQVCSRELVVGGTHFFFARCDTDA